MVSQVVCVFVCAPLGKTHIQILAAERALSACEVRQELAQAGDGPGCSSGLSQQ